MLITVHHRAGVKCGFADVRMFQRVKCGHISWILSADVTSKVRRCGCWKSITFCLLSYSSGVRTDCYAVIWYRARPVCDSWVCYTLDWCYAYGQPCAYVMKFYAYGHPLCTRAAVCIDTPMLCIRPHSTQFPLVSLLEAFLHFLFPFASALGSTTDFGRASVDDIFCQYRFIYACVSVYYVLFYWQQYRHYLWRPH